MDPLDPNAMFNMLGQAEIPPPQAEQEEPAAAAAVHVAGAANGALAQGAVPAAQGVAQVPQQLQVTDLLTQLAQTMAANTYALQQLAQPPPAAPAALPEAGTSGTVTPRAGMGSRSGGVAVATAYGTPEKPATKRMTYHEVSYRIETVTNSIIVSGYFAMCL